MNSPKIINKYLSSNKHHLEDLITRAIAISQLNQIMADFLGEPLNKHIQIANYREHTLILLADSPAWASRLRYQIPTLLPTLKQHYGFEECTNIKCRILPSITGNKPIPVVPIEKLSTTAVECISALALSVRDENLKSALERLASRSDKDR